MNRPRILVTGAAGYLGGAVLAAARARRLDARGTARVAAPGGGLVPTDLTDPAAVRDLLRDLSPDVVVHCAAAVPRDAAGYGDEGAAASSLGMVANLVACGVRRVVLISSMTVYGDAPRLPAGEDQEPDPATAYARAKRDAERLLAERLPGGAAVLRLPGLFGPPRRGGLIDAVARAFLACREPKVTAPAPLWAGLHIDDARDACLAAATGGDATTGTFNVGYPGPMSVDRTVALLAHLCGRAAPPPVPGPEFEFDLSRFHGVFGPFRRGFEARLADVVAACRMDLAEERRARPA